MARYPLTLTIDEMPESERPKRTVFLKAEEPPAAEQPKPDPPYEPGISVEDWNAFKDLLFGALRQFPDARAAVAAAFKKMRQTLKPEYEEPIYGPA